MAKPVDLSKVKLHPCIVRGAPRKNGWRYVTEVLSYYDKSIKNSRIYQSKIIGKLPPGESDLAKMVPCGKPGRSKKAEVISSPASQETLLSNEPGPESQKNSSENRLTLSDEQLTLLVSILMPILDERQRGIFWGALDKVGSPGFRSYMYHRFNVSYDSIRKWSNNIDSLPKDCSARPKKSSLSLQHNRKPGGGRKKNN